jgi:hypothetical protein
MSSPQKKIKYKKSREKKVKDRKLNRMKRDLKNIRIVEEKLGMDLDGSIKLVDDLAKSYESLKAHMLVLGRKCIPNYGTVPSTDDLKKLTDNQRLLVNEVYSTIRVSEELDQILPKMKNLLSMANKVKNNPMMMQQILSGSVAENLYRLSDLMMEYGHTFERMAQIVRVELSEMAASGDEDAKSILLLREEMEANRTVTPEEPAEHEFVEGLLSSEAAEVILAETGNGESA